MSANIVAGLGGRGERDDVLTERPDEHLDLAGIGAPGQLRLAQLGRRVAGGPGVLLGEARLDLGLQVPGERLGLGVLGGLGLRR